MKSPRRFAVVLGALSIAADARADETHATCTTAFETAELRLRPSEGRLLDAREALRACALPACQPWMIDDCTKRLVEVEGRIPSVVFSAENARGVPVYDVRVLEGERELSTQIDGRAVEIDPGPHALVARRGASQVALSVVAIEGRKAQQVVFRFEDGAAPPVPPAPPPPLEAPAAPPLAHPWARPLAGGMLAGAVVASGLGIGFGVSAIAKKDDAHCDASDVCDGPLDSARHTARASTLSFIAAGALAAAGAVTFFLFGRTRVQASLDWVQVGTAW